jgi:hypothetical protein
MKTIIASDAIFPGRLMYWTGSGWTDHKPNARVFTTEQEVRGVLDRMEKDGVTAAGYPLP